MRLDLTLDLKLKKEYRDGFFIVELPILQNRLTKVEMGQEPAIVVYLSLEAKGEILPYFMNEPKTAFGFIHQCTLYDTVPKMFKDSNTKKALEETIERLKTDISFRDATFHEFDSTVRSYSLVHDVDLVDMLYSGSDQNDIDNLKQIRAACQKTQKKVYDRIAIAYIYLVSRKFKPVEFFKAESGQAGVAKRNSQAALTGFGHHLQERVFRALFDFGQYFEDRYKDLQEILPERYTMIKMDTFQQILENKTVPSVDLSGVKYSIGTSFANLQNLVTELGWTYVKPERFHSSSIMVRGRTRGHLIDGEEYKTPEGGQVYLINGIGERVAEIQEKIGFDGKVVLRHHALMRDSSEERRNILEHDVLKAMDKIVEKGYEAIYISGPDYIALSGN